VAKPDEDAPETEAQPTATAKGSSTSGGAKAEAKTTEPTEGTPEALPPTEQEQGGETAFTPQWLIDNSEAVLGHPMHVASGALAGAEEEFLTVDQAKSKIDAWLETPVVADTGEEG
jgi:hypothetical protein